jgi:hypothetical protein
MKTTLINHHKVTNDMYLFSRVSVFGTKHYLQPNDDSNQSCLISFSASHPRVKVKGIALLQISFRTLTCTYRSINVHCIIMKC